MELLAIIRIAGMIGKVAHVDETLNRMRLRRKYCCVLLSSTEENLGLIKNIRNFVAYGAIDEAVLIKLLKERGRIIEDSKKRISDKDAEKFAKEILAGKKLVDLKIKPFFRLHSPRGGIDSKIHFGKRKGVLGNNGKDINKLIERML